MRHRWLCAGFGLNAAALCALGRSSLCQATPEVPLDAPVYAELYHLHDARILPMWPLSGRRPLTELRIQSLLKDAWRAPDTSLLSPSQRGFWLRPTMRLHSELSFAKSHPRPFWLPARDEHSVGRLAGAVELACERQEGRPCGGGTHSYAELDSSAGYGTWVSAFSRLQARAGSTDGEGVRFDRLYANFEHGPIEITAGRSVVSFGPGRRSQLIWGSQPPPLNHVGLSVDALELPWLKRTFPVVFGGTYLLGRLDAPQHFPGSLVTIARGYAQFGRHVSLGLTHLLLLGGDGAPAFSTSQFLLEHVYRTGPWPGEGISDRRVALDLSVRLPQLGGSLYTELAFEDNRKQVASVFAHDADYLIGWGASTPCRFGRYGVSIEFLRTGARSQEHGLFITGMTHGARVTGPALGPQATSLYVSTRWDVDAVALSISPWSEVASVGSDVVVFPEQAAIWVKTRGTEETRLRSGLWVRRRFGSSVFIDGSSFAERVHNEGFIAGDRTNFGLSIAVTTSGFDAWNRAALR